MEALVRASTNLLRRPLFYRPDTWAALTPGQEKSVESVVSPPFIFVAALFASSAQIAQAAQSDLFATNQRLAAVGTDRPTPITGAVAQVIEQSRRCAGTAVDELRLVTSNGLHLGL